MENGVYILSAAHISAQQPLREDWFEAPIYYQEKNIKAIDVDFKGFLEPNSVRRMGKLLKRALVCGKVAMQRAGITNIDAIITATGLGCIDNTENFLDVLVRKTKKVLNPTPFMQSTHNMVGSVVALDANCHGYNIHYSQNFVSFEYALQDAVTRIQQGKSRHILLNAHDESSPIFDSILDHLPRWHFKDRYFKGETALSMVLGTEPTDVCLCEIKDVNLYFSGGKSVDKYLLLSFLQRNGLKEQDIDVLFCGMNGTDENDSIYRDFVKDVFPDKPVAGYKHIFGEHYTMSGIGLYAAAVCLQRRKVPLHLLLNERPIEDIRNILFYNHSEGQQHAFVLLTKNNKE